MNTLFLGVCKLARERDERFTQTGKLQNARESRESIGLTQAEGIDMLIQICMRRSLQFAYIGRNPVS